MKTRRRRLVRSFAVLFTRSCLFFRAVSILEVLFFYPS
jgi:hypothetical protein